MTEAEQVYFNTPLLVLENSKHSTQEPRFHALGKPDDKRFVSVGSEARGTKFHNWLFSKITSMLLHKFSLSRN